jgi:hypothetical protein
VSHIFAATVVLAVVGLGRALGMPIRVLVRDPAAVSGTSAAVGFLSNLGIVLWASAAAIALFSAVLLGRSRHPSDYARLLVAIGALTLVMMLDDLYMLHERILPRLTGIEMDISAYAYAAAIAAIAWRWRAVILRPGWVLGIVAVLWLAVSAGIDLMVFEMPRSRIILYEDGAKFFGIVAWTAWVAFLAYAALAPSLAQAPTAASPQVASLLRPPDGR